MQVGNTERDDARSLSRVGGASLGSAEVCVKPQNRLVRNSAFTFFGQVLPLFVGLVTIPYVIRGLGADAFGVLSIAATMLGYFSIFDLGLGRATTKYVAEYLDPQKISELPKLIYTSIAVQVLLGIVGGVATAALVPLLVSNVFKMPAALTSEARLSLFVLAAAVPILLCSNAGRGVLEAAQRFDLVNYVKVPISISFYVLAAVAIPMHWRVSTIVVASVLSRLAGAGAYLVLCFREFPELRNGVSFSRHELRHLLSFGGWVMVSSVAGQIFAYLERFMIASVLSVGLLTYYAAPFELITKVLIFPASAATALFPFASRHGTMQPHVISDVSARMTKYLLFIMTPLMALFIAFADTILRLWLGAEFAAQSTVVLQLLAVAFFLNAFAFVPLTSVQALGRPELKAILDLLALPAFAIYAWVLMKHMGIAGAAGAKLMSGVIDCVVLFYFAFRMKAFRLHDFVSGPLVRATLISAVLIAAVSVIAAYHLPLVIACSLVCVCFAAYTATFWVVAVTDDERSALKDVPRYLFSRRAVEVSAD